MPGKAKEQAEISGEKEIVETSTIQSMGKNKYGNIIQSELQEKLNSNAGNDKTEVIDNGDTLVVKFVDSGRYYEVDCDGNVSDPITIIVDEYAGDITKNGKYDGTSLEKAYRITCIEDLVSFSNMSKTNNFENLYVVLTRDLSFTSPLSYNDYSSTGFGNINGDDKINGLMEELTTGTGFTPISSTLLVPFKGVFTTDTGKVYSIKNIYENINNHYAGLFGSTENAIIENIGVTGGITSTSNCVGGIVCCDMGGTTIINCYNGANIVAEDGVRVKTGTGGIVGTLSETGVVNNCYNIGSVLGNSMVGGIVGHLGGRVSNSYNSGTIKSNETKTYTGTGGIAGGSINVTNAKIINCYNLEQGNVNGVKGTGGIIGSIKATANEKIKIVNSYNLAQISGGCAGGIIGAIYSDSTGSTTYSEIINCYNIGKISSGTYIGGIIGQVRQVYGTLTQYITNCFNGGEIGKNATNYGEFIGRKVSATILELNNCYYISSDANNIIGSGTITGTAEAMNVDENLISLLNAYVEEYNNNDKEDSNYEELKKWTLDNNENYLTLIIN